MGIFADIRKKFHNTFVATGIAASAAGAVTTTGCSGPGTTAPHMTYTSPEDIRAKPFMPLCSIPNPDAPKEITPRPSADWSTQIADEATLAPDTIKR